MSLTAVIFLLVYMAGCVMAFSRHPIYGLMAYVAVFYLHPPSRWWGAALPDPGWSMVAAAITLLALMMRKDRLPIAHVFREGIVRWLIVFLIWLCIQAAWALDMEMHTELMVLFFKYLVLVALMYACVDSEQHLRYFLWVHVLGCFFLGWVAFTEYTGGRFEGFGGPGIGDANTGAFQIVTGILAGAALFLSGKKLERFALFGLMPIIVNGLITTISRSGFLAAFLGGVAFNFFSPRQVRKLVMVLSILGVALFLALTSDVYWQRMDSLKQAGEEVEGVDTGTSRLVIINAQWQMFKKYPLGCGHRCTATLSPHYMADEYLTGPPGDRSRSSHNTFMSLLVEQGIPGAFMYAMYVWWSVVKVFSVWRICRRSSGSLPVLFPAIGAVVLVTIVGDLFVDYLKLEVRIWFIALLLVTEHLARAGQSADKTASPVRNGRQSRRPLTRYASAIPPARSSQR